MLIVSTQELTGSVVKSAPAQRPVGPCPPALSLGRSSNLIGPFGVIFSAHGISRFALSPNSFEMLNGLKAFIS